MIAPAEIYFQIYRQSEGNFSVDGNVGFVIPFYSVGDTEVGSYASLLVNIYT